MSGLVPSVVFLTVDAARPAIEKRCGDATRPGKVTIMADFEIVHPVDIEESSAWFASMATTFLLDPHPADRDEADTRHRRGWDTVRHWGARADGRWVGTLGTMTRPLSVPGTRGGTELVPADALTMVTVAGTHRRRGILRRMLSESLAEARDRGDPVAILFAAEWGIYGRFGYAPASFAASYELDSRLRGASLPAAGAGTVRQVEPTELAEPAPKIFEAERRQRPGNIDRKAFWWQFTLGLEGLAPNKINGRVPTFLLRTGEDGPDGYLAWVGVDVEHAGVPGTVDVVELCAATPAAYRALWGYLTNLDLVARIRVPGRPVDESLRWLLGDGRALRQTDHQDALWLRVMDVPTALSARHYATDGEVTFEVVDDDVGGYAAGRFTLRAGPDGAECVRTPRATADLQLGQRALASVYLGATSLRAQVGARQIDELSPGALDRADALFGTAVAPWCATEF
jgi:predicted acetyltransferase